MITKVLSTVVIDLKANDTVQLPYHGDFIRIDSASGNVRFKTNKGDSVIMAQGKAIKLVDFTKGEIVDLTGADQTVTIEIGFGEVESGELTGSVSISPAATIPTTADAATGAVAIVCAANANRKTVTIQALSTNTAVVRVGDANTGAARGAELQAGQSVTFATTAAIYAYSATAQAVAIFEEQ